MTCELLETMIDAHGGLQKWFEFSRATARVLITGDVWSSPKGEPVFADTQIEILTQEESVTMVSNGSSGLRSVFRPNIIQLEVPGEELVETRYNPRTSFEAGGRLSEWDKFQMAYVCSYSIWNCLTQPFLFSFSGFEIEEVAPRPAGTETWRTIKVEYPEYIVSPSRQIICYVGDDGLMRQQDFVHHNLNDITISSVMTEYAEIQGMRLPVVRKLYLAKDLENGTDAPLFASIQIKDIAFS